MDSPLTTEISPKILHFRFSCFLNFLLLQLASFLLKACRALECNFHGARHSHSPWKYLVSVHRRKERDCSFSIFDNNNSCMDHFFSLPLFLLVFHLTEYFSHCIQISFWYHWVAVWDAVWCTALSQLKKLFTLIHPTKRQQAN